MNGLRTTIPTAPARKHELQDEHLEVRVWLRSSSLERRPRISRDRDDVVAAKETETTGSMGSMRIALHKVSSSCLHLLHRLPFGPRYLGND